MYRQIVHFLQGQVLVRIECGCPERVLNLCGARGIPFWELTWESPVCLTLRAVGRDLPRLRQAAEDAGGSLHLCRSGGVPVFWRRLRRRYVLLAGAVLAVTLMFGGNLVIWDFQVSGNDTVPTESVLQALERCGVRVGTRGVGLDQDELRNRVLPLLPDVVYLAVNVKGCTAHVQVVERKRPPAVVQESQVCNVVARREGLVTRVQALDGKAVAAPGSVVTEGELLISGVADSERSGLRLLHGMGEVWARTWYDLSVSVPLKTTEKTGEGRKKLHLSLDFGRRRIKFYGKGSITGVDCDKITYYKPFTLPGGLRLPLTLVRERITAWEGTAAERTEQSARQEGEQQLLALLSARLPEGSTVTDTRFAAVRQGDRLTVVLKAEGLEQIGQTVTLPETETTQR